VSIPLAAAEGFIDASGVAPRTEALLPIASDLIPLRLAAAPRLGE
jgi:hypothetical protein